MKNGKKKSKKPRAIVPAGTTLPVAEELKSNQDLFCRLYSGPGENFGNATMSYSIAFGIDIPDLLEYPRKPEVKRGKKLPKWYAKALDACDKRAEERKKALSVCAASASRLLRNVKVLERCDQVLTEHLSDSVVDAELSYTVIQREDLPSKMRAIAEYNRMKKRVSDAPFVPIQINNIIEEDRKKYA